MFIREDLHKVNLLHLLELGSGGEEIKLKDFVWILQFI